MPFKHQLTRETMSQLITTAKALEIVKECCAKVSPSSKASSHLRDAIRAIESVLPTPILEAGITLPGPVRVAPTKTSGGTGQVRAILGRVQTSTAVIPVPELSTALRMLRAIQDKIDTEDPCVEMVGCCAKGFRKNALDQKSPSRKKTVNMGFVKHFIPAGTSIPRNQIHTKRQ